MRRSLLLSTQVLIRSHGWLVPVFVLVVGLFAMTLFLFSPFVALGVFMALGIGIAVMLWPWYTVVFLAWYLPFESLVLRVSPDALYAPLKFLVEVLIYILVFRVGIEVIAHRRYHSTPLDISFLLLMVTTIASAVVNFVPLEIGLFGIRSIIRFILIFFVVIQLKPTREQIQKVIIGVLAIVVLQGLIGFAQNMIGLRADEFLQAQGTRYYQDIQISSGVIQTWDPGRRISATLGRYDMLGTWLSLFLLIAVGLLYYMREQRIRRLLYATLMVGIPALMLTQSRASWFGFAIGVFVISVLLQKDKRVMWGYAGVAVLIVVYVLYSGLTVHYLLDPANASFSERFFEAFSVARWRAEYYDLGRLYFVVQTPLTVVATHPLFGVGPGMYGGGVATYFHNSLAYDRLNLPFGSRGVDGFIDNNWFSLWGELGMVGIIIFGSLLWFLGKVALQLWRRGTSLFARGVALGYVGLLCAASWEAFLGTHFEIKTFAIYLWMMGGFVVLMAQESLSVETHY